MSSLKTHFVILRVQFPTSISGDTKKHQEIFLSSQPSVNLFKISSYPTVLPFKYEKTPRWEILTVPQGIPDMFGDSRLGINVLFLINTLSGWLFNQKGIETSLFRKSPCVKHERENRLFIKKGFKI